MTRWRSPSSINNIRNRDRNRANTPLEEARSRRRIKFQGSILEQHKQPISPPQSVVRRSTVNPEAREKYRPDTQMSERTVQTKPHRHLSHATPLLLARKPCRRTRRPLYPARKLVGMLLLLLLLLHLHRLLHLRQPLHAYHRRRCPTKLRRWCKGLLKLWRLAGHLHERVRVPGRLEHRWLWLIHLLLRLEAHSRHLRLSLELLLLLLGLELRLLLI